MQSCDLFEMNISFQFDDFRRYLSFIEESLKREREDSHQRWLKETEGMTPYEKQVHFEYCGGDDDHIDITFPRLLGRSALVMLWSLFENAMVSLCRGDISIEAGSLEKGEKEADMCRTLEHVKKHLESRNVHLPWQNIEGILDVRNQLVHDNGFRYYHDGNAEPTDLEMRSTFRRSTRVDRYVLDREAAGKSGISFDHEQLAISSSFCNELADTLQAFVLAAGRAMPEIAIEKSEARLIELIARQQKRRFAKVK